MKDRDKEPGKDDDRKDADKLFQHLRGSVEIQTFEALDVAAQGT